MARPTKITRAMISEARQVCASGVSRNGLAIRWDVSPGSINRWIKTNAEFRTAVETGEAEWAKTKKTNKPSTNHPTPIEPWQSLRGEPPLIPRLINRSQETSQNPNLWPFIFGYLPPPLLPTWELICECLAGSCRDTREVIQPLTNHEKTHLFLFAYSQNHFNTTAALLALNMTRQELEKWIAEDFEFASAWHDTAWHRRNTYEAALMRAVINGEVSAIIFANRTLNRKRGYGESPPVPVTTEPAKPKSTVPISSLDLPFQLKVDLLKAIRKQRRLHELG